MPSFMTEITHTPVFLINFQLELQGFFQFPLWYYSIPWHPSNDFLFSGKPGFHCLIVYSVFKLPSSFLPFLLFWLSFLSKWKALKASLLCSTNFRKWLSKDWETVLQEISIPPPPPHESPSLAFFHILEIPLCGTHLEQCSQVERGGTESQWNEFSVLVLVLHTQSLHGPEFPVLVRQIKSFLSTSSLLLILFVLLPYPSKSFKE